MDKEKNEVIEEAAVSEESQTSTIKRKKIGSKKKKSLSEKSNEVSVNQAPENGDAPTIPTQENEAEAVEEIKSEAAPEQLIADVTFDALIVDEDAVIVSEDNEENSGFDEFLSDYKKVMEETLSAAKSASAKDDTAEEAEETESEDVIISEDGESTQLTMDISEAEPVSDSENDREIDKRDIYNPEKPRAIDTVFDFLELFVFTLAAVLIITSFFFKHTIVVGGSMDKTLENGEHLIISDLFYTPKRNDIIVFQDASTGLDYPLVKRVIGIEGDTVTVDELGRVSVNGGPVLEEEYAYFDPNIHYTKGKITVVVPEGEVFVLGDNRYNSQDSRSFPNKTVKVDCILGKVLLRIFPFDSFGTVNN